MAEIVAGAAKDSQLGVSAAENKIEEKRKKLEDEIKEIEDQKAKALKVAKLAILKDDNIKPEEKIEHLEALDKSSRWQVISGIFNGFSLTMIFNTIVYLIIIWMLTG